LNGDPDAESGVKMRSTLGWTALVLLGIAPLSASPLLAQAIGTDLLPAFKAAEIFKAACPSEFAAILKPADEQFLAARFVEMMQFEVGRVQLITPGTSADAAQQALEKHMLSATEGLGAMLAGQGCAAPRHAAMLNQIKSEFTEAKIAVFKRQIEMGVPYETARPLTSEPGAPLTYTAPYFGQFIFNGPLRQMKVCKLAEVTGIEIVSKIAKPIDKQPPHIRPQQQIIENWTWTCDGQIQRGTLTYWQDDRSQRGVYTVKNPAK
jgi:hypothetical protein